MLLHSCLDALKRLVATRADETLTPIAEPALLSLGYALFLWSSLILISVTEIGPDLLVSAITYLAGTKLLRLKQDALLLNFAFFGVILGIGYWAKAVMFPVGIIFLGISILKVRQWKRNLASAVAFAMLAAPLVAALSLSRGRFTFSDSGVLNYASYVSPGGRVIHWQGLPVGSGTPKHPTRTLRLNPVIYEFNGPIGGTYPPSYDPSYWNEGHRSTLNVRAQMAAIADDILATGEILLVAQPSLMAVFLFFLFWSPDGFRDSLAQWWQLLTVSTTMIGLYMLVHVEGRYIAAGAVLIWLLLFCALRIPADHGSHNIGTLAVIGAGNFSYWAHLAHLRIVAEIMQMDGNDFWSLADPEREKFFAAFRSTGAQWLIAQPPAVLVPALANSWEPIGSTSYYRYSLARPREGRTSTAQR
jgi:hypothetical protein